MHGLGKFRPLIAFLRLMGREKWALSYCCSRRGTRADTHCHIGHISNWGGGEGVQGGVRGNKKLGYCFIEACLQLEARNQI